MLNRSTLKKAGKKWVEKDIISPKQLEQILNLYPKREPRLLLTIFSILLISIGFLTFIFSDWAQVPQFSRVLLMVLFMVTLYVAGHILYEKEQKILGITLLLLGFVAFGANLLLAINIYSIILFNAWPFVLWSIVSLFLFMIYEHRWIFFTGIAVTTIGQINSFILYDSFNYFLIAILLLGFTHFAYHRKEQLYCYLVTISFVLQAVFFINVYEQSYYWLLFYYMLLYIIGYILKGTHFSVSIRRIALISTFILGMFQSFVLHDVYLFSEEIEYNILFFTVWMIAFTGITLLKISQNNYEDLAPIILYLPVFYLPFASIFSLLVLFTFSLTYIMIGYTKDNYSKVFYGSIAFLLSTLTAYVQYAWDTLNKSLFFIIGGIILLAMSLVIERQRRILRGESGDVR